MRDIYASDAALRWLHPRLVPVRPHPWTRIDDAQVARWRALLDPLTECAIAALPRRRWRACGLQRSDGRLELPSADCLLLGVRLQLSAARELQLWQDATCLMRWAAADRFELGALSLRDTELRVAGECGWLIEAHEVDYPDAARLAPFSQLLRLPLDECRALVVGNPSGRGPRIVEALPDHRCADECAECERAAAAAVASVLYS